MEMQVRSGGAKANAGYAATAGEWKGFIDGVDPKVRQAAARMVEEAATHCVEVFYAALLAHPDSRGLISNEMVDSRLRHSLRGWLLDLFAAEAPDMEQLVANQIRVGRVHARIRVPVHAVLHGARLLKRELALRADGDGDVHGAPAGAIRQYCYVMIDLAVEVLSHSFGDDMQEAAENDGIYQAMTISQDMALERETQRAALLEWGQRLLFDICRGLQPSCGRLADSTFGLWLRHKGSLLFGGLGEMGKVNALIDRVDGVLLPSLQPGGAAAGNVLHELNSALGDIGYLVDGMFGILESMEGGRDPLTRTLNRRFLSTIVGREIGAAARTGASFSVLMVDVDHFKSVNDNGGHAAGDAVLRHVADVLLQCTRSSDFVFRYGGEEFAVALVETPLAKAMEVAERIRLRIAETPFALGRGIGDLRLTVSIGVAQFEGHPDYAVLLEAADQALYRAKRNGRNRCEVATPHGR